MSSEKTGPGDPAVSGVAGTEAGVDDVVANSPKRRVPTQARALATYERIVATAGDIAVANGLDAVTVLDVTAAAGVSKGAFYGYFTGIEELIDEVRARLRREDLRYLTDFFSERTYDDPANVVLDLASWYADRFRGNDLARRLFLERGRDIGADPLDGPEWEFRRPWRMILQFLESDGLLSRDIDDDMLVHAEAAYCQFEALLDLAFRRDPQGDKRVLLVLDEMLLAQFANLQADTT